MKASSSSKGPNVEGQKGLPTSRNQFSALMELDNTNEEPVRSPITTNDVSPLQDHTDRVRMHQSHHEPRNDITTRRVKGKDIIKAATENWTNLVNPFYRIESLPIEIPSGFSFKSSSKHNSQPIVKAPRDGQVDVHNVDPQAGNFQLLFSAGDVTHSRGRGSRLSGHRKFAQDTANRSFVDSEPAGPAGKRKRVSHCRVEAPSNTLHHLRPMTFLLVAVKVLLRSTSDHLALKVSTCFTPNSANRPLVRVIKKLELTQSSLFSWAKSCVGDISLCIKSLRDELDKLLSLELASAVNDKNHEILIRNELKHP
ncbi:uncharacterized protein LOC116267641 [Nymphaea colorata]|nr:uncharacterized protein LOC116267641 [Nymphaea colorata]